jgi:uncharacterized membrane protein
MPIAMSPLMSKRIVTASLLSLCLAAGIGAPAALAAPPVVPRAAATESQPATQRDAKRDRAQDTARYAAAERTQPKAADFEGGATFVVIGSTTAVILGVVLLVVLL